MTKSEVGETGRLHALIDALEPLLDDADGYDISNLRWLIRGSEHWNDEYRDKLLKAEERARLAWKDVRAALREAGQEPK